MVLLILIYDWLIPNHNIRKWGLPRGQMASVLAQSLVPVPPMLKVAGSIRTFGRWES